MTKKTKRYITILFTSIILIQTFIGANINAQFVETSHFSDSTDYRTENPLAGAEYLINTDPSLIKSGNIEVILDDVLSGTITGNPFPLGTKIDLLFNNLTYFRSKVYDPDIFSIPISSTELYSRDIRDLPGISVNHSDLSVFTYYDDRTADIKYDDTTRTRSLQGIKKEIFPYAGISFLEYQNLDLEQFCENESFEGIHIDLLIPDCVSIWSGATYAGMTVQFVEEIVGDDDKIWETTISGTKILESYLETTAHYVFDDMWSHQISLKIGFKELEDIMPGFNISKINNISITGIDNYIHPGFSIFDPTFANQLLVCAGIYLVDIINNVSSFSQENLGNSPQYNFSIYVPEGALIGDVAYASQPFYFKHQNSNISTDYLMNDRISRFNQINISFIDFDGGIRSFDTPYLIEKGYNLTAEYDNGTRFQFGIPSSNEIGESQTFDIIDNPGRYYNFFLEYSGNPFYNATKYHLKDQIELSIPILYEYNVIPENPVLNDSLVLDYVYDSIDGLPQGNPLTYWYVNDSYHPEYDNLIVIPSSETIYEDQWYAKIRPYDGITYGDNYTTNTVTINNLPPIIWNVQFNKSQAYENEILVILYQYDDPDGAWADVVVSIKWYLNETHMPEFDDANYIGSEHIIKDDIWKVEIFVADSYMESETITRETTVLKNYPATISYEGEYEYSIIWGESNYNTVTWRIIDQTTNNPWIYLYENDNFVYPRDYSWDGEYLDYEFDMNSGYYNFSLIFNDGLGEEVSCSHRFLYP